MAQPATRIRTVYEDAGEWFVYNEDGAPIPEGTAFNVAISASDENAR